MCFDVGWITTCWRLTETLPADSSAYFSPLVEGCARKARILPNAEGKGHLNWKTHLWRIVKIVIVKCYLALLGK